MRQPPALQAPPALFDAALFDGARRRAQALHAAQRDALLDAAAAWLQRRLRALRGAVSGVHKEPSCHS